MEGRHSMLAITNARLLPVSTPPFERGTLLVEDGKIAAVGPDVRIPDTAVELDARGRTVTPGIVEAHAHIGLTESGVGWEGADGDEATQPITASARAIDGIDPLDLAFEDFRAAGITCANVMPGNSNLVGGLGVAIKCSGTVVDTMVVREPTALKLSLGEDPKTYYGAKGKAPSTRMGNAALIRQALTEAREYYQKTVRAEAGEETPPKPKRNLQAFIPVFRGDIPLAIHCERADDIVTAVRICREFDLRFVLDHVTEAHLLLDFLSELDTHLAVGPLLHYPAKVETREIGFGTSVAVSQAGIGFCLTSDHPTTNGKYLPLAAGMAVGWGMDYDAALRSITLGAAEHIGIDDCVGSLEVGKDADIVIWSDDPLEFVSHADYTIISGAVVFQRGGGADV